MLTVERRVLVHRPIEQVFTCVANFETEPQDTMRKSSPEPIGLGTTRNAGIRKSTWSARHALFGAAHRQTPPSFASAAFPYQSSSTNPPLARCARPALDSILSLARARTAPCSMYPVFVF